MKGYCGDGLSEIDPGAEHQSWMKITLSKKPKQHQGNRMSLRQDPYTSEDEMLQRCQLQACY